MNPGSDWVVEFAVREKQAHEQGSWERIRQEEGIAPDRAAPGFGRQRLGHVVSLLIGMTTGPSASSWFGRVGRWQLRSSTTGPK